VFVGMTVLQLGIFNGIIIQFCFSGRNIDLLRHDIAVPHFKTDEAALSCLKTIEASVPHMKSHEAAVPLFSCILVVCKKYLKELRNNKYLLCME
jgi:hypothetical protein